MPPTPKVPKQEKLRALLRRARFDNEPLDALVAEIDKLYQGVRKPKAAAKK